MTGALGQTAPEPPAKPAVITAKPDRASELEAARRAYIDQHYAEAERHVQSALKADPNSLIAKVYLARLAQGGTHYGDRSAVNRTLALQAIGRYTDVLGLDPGNLEAVTALANLNYILADEEKWAEWELKLAQNGSMPNAERIRAYEALANRPPGCSPAVLGDTPFGLITPIPNRKPAVADPALREAALECAVNGLEYAEASLILGDQRAWSTKAALLQTLAALSAKLGRTLDAQNYQQLAELAQKQVEKLAAAAPYPHAEYQIDEVGTLDERMISIPKLVYPPVARAAHAEGKVLVQITFDDDGFVLSAMAVSGHPLLRAAAMTAARWARIDTKRSPERSGTISMEFKLADLDASEVKYLEFNRL